MLAFKKFYLSTIALCFASLSIAEPADRQDYDLKIEVARKGPELHTKASFHVPLDKCQAYRFLVDYDASLVIPGVIGAKTTRLGENKASVELDMQETILLFPVYMKSVLEFVEIPYTGTDFVQISGLIKSYRGSWRIAPKPAGTTFHYQAISEPDSALPMFVIQFIIEHKLKETFEALAKGAAGRSNSKVLPCS